MLSTTDSPHSKGSKGTELLDDTPGKVLSVIALCGICIVVLMAVVPAIIFFKECGTKLRLQMSNITGRTLFAFFIVALLLSISSIIMWNVMIFEDSYPFDSYDTNLKSRVLYDSSKWGMSMFFIFR